MYDINVIFETLSYFFTWPAPLFLIIGVGIGMLFGILPGLGGPQALALSLPLTFGLDARLAIIMLIGITSALAFSGSISAILINTPGTPVSAATIFDGYPLARQGKAGYALGAAGTSSALGALFGAIVLILLLPFGRQLVLSFSYPEYFMIAVFGLSIIIVIAKEALLKGLMAALLGLMLTTIGFDPITGSVRFVFGVMYLYDGIRLIPALVGIFAIAESIGLFLEKGTIAKEKFEGNIGGIFEGIKAVFKNFGIFLRSSVIGVIIGMIPGVGGSVSNFIAYAHAVQSSKDKSMFGKGDIRGVIAPEAANDSKEGGALFPTLVFGIPGSVVMAILIGALMIHGIRPGPRLILDHPELILTLIFTLIIGNFLTTTIGLLAARFLVKVTVISTTYIAPIVIALALTGVYVLNGYMGDIIVALAFGVIGFFMKQFGYPRVALVIAIVLGKLVQESFHLTLMVMGPEGFFIRPISLILVIVTIITLLFALIKRPKKGVKRNEDQRRPIV